MRINQNVMALVASRHLQQSWVGLGRSLERLSSGLRINRAADDAAGLVRSERLRSEVGGSRQALRNVQDGISMVQTVDGALGEVHAILQRLRQLAVSALNTATNDGVAEQAERVQLEAELESIGRRTRFSGSQLLGDDTLTPFVLQTGPNAGDTFTFQPMQLFRSGGALTFGVDGVTTPASLDTGSLAGGNEDYLRSVDEAIAAVSGSRAYFGAIQNRLEHTSARLSVSVENLSAAESRIRDVDVAREIVDLTRYQILQQVGVAMLAQANQVPSSVLSLLR